jgi:hypothetical protein
LRTAQRPSRQKEVEEGRLPRYEFDRFPELSNAEIVDLNFRYPGPSILDKIFKRIGLFLSIIKLTLWQGKKFDQYVTTGEDIGIPFALAMLLSLNSKPLHIIFHGHYMGGGVSSISHCVF